MLSRLPSLFLSLVLLVCIWTGATELESTLTVDLDDEDARNKVFERAPAVCYVRFLLPEGYQIVQQQCSTMSDSSCTVDTNGSNSLNATFEKDSSSISFNIEFDTTLRVGCNNYIPNIRFIKDEPRRTVACRPVFPCQMAQSQPTFNTTQWWRFANVTVLDEFLSSPNKSSFEDQHLITDNNDNTVSSNQTHLELYFVAQRYQVVGYYVATISSSANDGYLYQQDFVVYANPAFKDSSGYETVVLGPGDVRDFTRMFCHFGSFPAAQIEWNAPSASNYATRDVGDDLVLGVESDPDLSLDGRLVFEKVRFEDGGEYTCTAVHSISGQGDSRTLKLRVNSFLRPLWPSIGILASFIITFLFIFGGAVVNKIRGNHAADDEGAFQRNYSVVSNIGEDAGDKKRTRKHQAAGKRTSITQQELLADASDPN